MTAQEGSPTCEAVREELPELALGTLSGRERSAALNHLASCSSCRSELEQLALAADAVVQLAPQAEPPVGFEVRLFDRLGIDAVAPPVRPTGPRRCADKVVLAGVVAVALAFGAGWLAAPGAALRPSAVNGGIGGRLTSAALTTDGRHVGEVTVDAAEPSWMFMTMADAGRSAEVTCEVTTVGGRTVSVGSFWLSPGGYGAWGAVLPVLADQVRSARVVAADGTVVAGAVLRT